LRQRARGRRLRSADRDWAPARWFKGGNQCALFNSQLLATLSTDPAIAGKIGPAMVQAAAMIASGQVHIPVAATYPISSIKQAVAHAQKSGKILLDVAGSST
jgi:NADPH:quinone reductase-like Zn-dependent oxidoreductase